MIVGGVGPRRGGGGWWASFVLRHEKKARTGGDRPQWGGEGLGNVHRNATQAQSHAPTNASQPMHPKATTTPRFYQCAQEGMMRDLGADPVFADPEWHDISRGEVSTSA